MTGKAFECAALRWNHSRSVAVQRLGCLEVTTVTAYMGHGQEPVIRPCLNSVVKFKQSEPDG